MRCYGSCGWARRGTRCRASTLSRALGNSGAPAGGRERGPHRLAPRAIPGTPAPVAQSYPGTPSPPPPPGDPAAPVVTGSRCISVHPTVCSRFLWSCAHGVLLATPPPSTRLSRLSAPPSPLPGAPSVPTLAGRFCSPPLDRDGARRPFPLRNRLPRQPQLPAQLHVSGRQCLAWGRRSSPGWLSPRPRPPSPLLLLAPSIDVAPIKVAGVHTVARGLSITEGPPNPVVGRPLQRSWVGA